MALWLLHYRCDSILDLALGCPNLSSPFRNIEQDYSIASDSRGRLALNKDGGHVRLHTPSAQGEAHDVGNFSPTVGIVRLLINAGAQVSAGAREAAKGMPDRNFVQMVEEALRTAGGAAGQAAAVSAGARAASSDASIKQKLEGEVAVEISKLDEIGREETMLGEARAQQVAELRRKLQDAKAERDNLRARIEEVRRGGNSSRRTPSTPPGSGSSDLDREVASLRLRLATLERENAYLRSEVDALRAAQVQSPHGFPPPLESRNLAPPTPPASQPPVPVPPRPARTVESIMYVVEAFSPRDSDEIMLRLGDEVFVNIAHADGWGSGHNISTQAAGLFPLSHVASTPGSIRHANPPSMPAPRYDSKAIFPTSGNGQAPPVPYDDQPTVRLARLQPTSSLR
ncbi:hypothetical protein HDU93_000740 [Gonapodya sp. JEL0774]|nr:hypothetical protein HDU93_000740 [Gonapodya sp. JEL0774]